VPEKRTALRNLVFRAILVLGMLAILEGFAWVATALLSGRNYLYVTPRAHGPTKSFAEAQRARRPGLGGPPLFGKFAIGGPELDTSGSRRSTAFPDPSQPSCVEAFGDSFVYGWEVDDEHAWPNRLAETLHCRVANYGVPGYGSDQAYLRYLQTPDRAKVVIWSHMGENILRDVTRIRDLTSRGLDYGFKPRFVLDARGELRLIPLPELTEQQYQRVVGLQGPPMTLPYETFQPGGQFASRVRRFPFTYTLLSGWSDFRLRARMANRRPPWAEFYHPDHPTHALQILTSIGRAFAREAAKRRQHALVLVLPESRDLEYYERTKMWTYQPFLDALDADKIAYAHFGPYVLAKRGHGAVEGFRAGGHYDEQSNALLATFVAERLRAHGFIEASTSAPGRAVP